MKVTRRLFAYPYTIWMALFILVPMLLIAYYAFTGDANGSTTFTLQNLADVFTPVHISIFLRSLEFAAISTAICLALGYPLAYILSRMKSGKFAITLIILPMWMNFLLRTYSWMILLDTNGLINQLLVALGMQPATLLYTPGAVILGMVYNFLPFMVLPIYSALSKMPKSYIEAAQDLGANGRRVFAKVILPISLPGVISGIVMVFIPAITTFAISRLLGGAQFMLLGDLIENQFLLVNNWSLGSGLSFVLMILVLISIAILNRFDKDHSEGGMAL